MPERRGRKSPYTIDLVLCTALTDQLAVLLWRTPEGREKWALPWDYASPDETLKQAAARIATEALGTLPEWIEQVAGDLLPNATTEQRVATGFYRNTLTNKEGGVDQEQFRVEQVVDRAAAKLGACSSTWRMSNSCAMAGSTTRRR